MIWVFVMNLTYGTVKYLCNSVRCQYFYVVRKCYIVDLVASLLCFLCLGSELPFDALSYDLNLWHLRNVISRIWRTSRIATLLIWFLLDYVSFCLGCELVFGSLESHPESMVPYICLEDDL